MSAKAQMVKSMNENMYAQMYDVEKTHWWFRAKRDIVLGIVKSFFLPQSSQIIDFGCGTGIMLESLSAYGNVTGVDFSPIALEFCKKRFNGPLLRHDLAVKLPVLDKFDVGVALDVLEHVDDDLEALKNMKNTLNIGGRLIVTVPALMFLWTAHDENLMHRRRYSARELSKLIHAAGLEIEYLSYYNFCLFPAVALLRLIFKLLNINQDSAMENKQRGRITNALLYRIFKSESFFIRKKIKLPFGISLIAVLRRAG